MMWDLINVIVLMILVILLGTGACAYILYKNWKEDKLDYGKNND